MRGLFVTGTDTSCGKTAVACALARTARKAGLRVHVLKPIETGCADPDAPAEDALHLIDLQRVMKPRWRQRRWIVKDIASLNYSTPRALVSQTDRMRWLKTYLGSDRIDAEAKRFVRLVVAKSRQIGRHDRRRSRRLAKGIESS